MERFASALLPPEHPVPRRTASGQALAIGLLHRSIRRGHLRMRFGDGSELLFGDPSEHRIDGRIIPPLTLTALPWQTWLRVIANPGLALPRSFIEGIWTLEEGDLASLIYLFRANAREFACNPLARLNELRWGLQHQIAQLNPVFRSKPRIEAHYDRGDAVYESFLDPLMQYSCAFFPRLEAGLDEAQENKVRTTIERLRIDRPGLEVLDIGCGWGGLSRTIARLTGARVTGITISPNQKAFAERRRAEINEPGLRERLIYEEQDYRRHRADTRGAYDRIVSVGMLEHVGLWHFGTYFRTIRRLLKADGRAVVHSIVARGDGPTAEWIAKEVFPGGYIPRPDQVSAALRGADLRIEDAHEHDGWHYRRTLECWDERFARRWRTRWARRARAGASFGTGGCTSPRVRTRSRNRSSA